MEMREQAEMLAARFAHKRSLRRREVDLRAADFHRVSLKAPLVIFWAHWSGWYAAYIVARQDGKTHSIQGLNCDDPERKDLLMDIGTEELSHLEIVGTLARMHLKPMKASRDAAEVDPLVAIAGGGGVSLFNSMGDAWTADYLKITGELDVDLRSNIAAEARAKIVYERLINFCDDPGSKDALQFLMTREITHMKAFTAALESMGKDRFSIGEIPPTPGLVDQYFNDSTGVGDKGEEDARGPWNEGGDWEIVEAPDLEQGVENLEVSDANVKSSKMHASEKGTRTRKTA
jgi:Mn-containing catalase